MSKLGELICEFCSNGVETVKIKNAFQRLKGTPITAARMKEINNPEGEIKVFAGGKTVITAKEKDIPNANIIRVPAVLVQSRGVIDVIYYDKPFTFKNEMWAYTTSDSTTVKYLFYVLKNNVQRFRDAASGMGSLPQISLPVTEEFEIPFPPIEVQREIVKILDQFTTLEAELEAELEARTLQYEYYRDSLFEALDCPRVPLGSLGVRNKGIAITASKMRTLEPGNKDVRIFAAGSTFVDTDSSFIPDKGILEGPAIIVKSRGHIGFEYYEGKFTHKNELWSYSLTSDLVEQKFIYYYLLTQAYHLHELARGKSVKLPQLAVKDTDELLVPLPSLAEQQRIVDILDRFDALTSSLSEGLPAELTARRSQYEYYRDQLLSFPRKGENQ